MKYISDNWSQEDWDIFGQKLANFFGVEYTPTPYEPLDSTQIEPLRSNFDWTGLKHTESTRELMCEQWDDTYRNPTTLAKYKENGQKRWLDPESVYWRPESRAKAKANISAKWKDPTSGYQNLKGHYVITDPAGNVYHVLGLKPFCREHGLTDKYMARQANGRKSTPYKGWTCRKA